ncbi:hypothetical protein E1218_10770 [Kribbella turkmenica]|uniref:Uncharacterized protein n=1 Tax=Kribbella turkmenica TaxID=2530375 RepID=A0A4R4X9T8_9ACTN|nr:hypothetical protein [Kribbella turkmenica]TDD27306.1 hypothetical protein E1218_10770 [Kribbella turkmenica]
MGTSAGPWDAAGVAGTCSSGGVTVINGFFGGGTPELRRDQDGVPILSAGSHRHPRDGACFMEYAAYLAGEPWSDHPSCTHPLLAHLAREVNDRTSDSGRRELAPLIPSVIGLTSHDPIVYPRLVARVARTALPVVAPQDQVVLAVALIRAEQLTAEIAEPSDESGSDAGGEVLAENAPARRWAEAFLRRHPRPRLVTYLRRAAPNSLSAATRAASRSTHTGSDGLLRQMLADGIETVERLTRRAPTAGAPSIHAGPGS